MQARSLTKPILDFMTLDKHVYWNKITNCIKTKAQSEQEMAAARLLTLLEKAPIIKSKLDDKVFLKN